MSANAATRRRLTREARRSQILDVAEETFAELGYQGASLEDVAARAGITRPLIYTHFESKDELYLEILKTARGELEASMISAVASVSGAERQLRAATRAYFTFVQEQGRRWDMLFGGGAAVAGAVAEEAAELRFQTAEKIAALVTSAAPGVPAEHALAYAHAISGCGEQLAKWWRRHPDVPLEDIVDRQMEILWSGLRTQVRRAQRS
jgi:AcrR family transcriptional regulator